jgi:hypothetical protein
MVNDAYVLWTPDTGRCATCAVTFVNARVYSATSSHHTFCKQCWTEFLEECQIDDGWVADTQDRWDEDETFMILVQSEV